MPETSSTDPSKRIEELFSRLLETNPLQAPHYAQLQQGKIAGWMWECDQHGRLTWCSQEVADILGYAPSELIGEAFPHWGFTAEASERIRAAMAEHESIHNLRVQGIAKNGEQLALLINALARGKRSDEERGYRGAVHVVGDIETSDPLSAREGEPDSTSATPLIEGRADPEMEAPLWQQIPGYELVQDQLTPADAAQPDDIPEMPQVETTQLRVPIPGQEGPLGILEFDREAGSQPWTQNDVALVSSVAQQLSLALQDTRSYHLTQQALEELRLADQLKTQFLANISHELRTPLNSIIGFSRVILKGIDGPITQTQEEDLGAIYKAGQHLLGLINNILDLSKIEAGKMELNFAEVDLEEVIAEVMATAEGLVQDKPIEISLDMPAELPTLQGDRIRIQQVLLNLLSNAAKFTDEGQINLTVQVDARKDPEELIIAVSDTGPGIRPEDQTKLFEPFSQVDATVTRQTGGTGLGLSISRHLVELHGGRIWVDSTPGLGSTFAFAIPVVPTAVGEDAIQAQILAVGEEAATLARYQSALGAAGYGVQRLENPENAVEQAVESQPKVLLLNPTHSGCWKILPHLKQHAETWKIPIVTATLLTEQQRGLDMGIRGYLSKPFESLHVYTILNRNLDPLQSHDVLLIDDDVECLDQLEEIILASGDFQVQTAATGFEGLVAARSHVPDLVILNIFMPNADGFRMIEALRMDERTQSVPVILLIPPSFSPVHLQQLKYWTEHYQETATSEMSVMLQTLQVRIEELT